MAGRPSISFFINECGRLPYSSANIRNSLEKHNNNPDYYTFSVGKYVFFISD